MADKSNPNKIGAFLATSGERPFLIKKSETKPESNTPANAAKNGIEAKKPDLRKSRPLNSTRYVGNQVKKKIETDPMQN